ncbi:DNA-binding domain-containing protein, AraC-type [Opitutaceae bacterium TAV1]|nr:DNA-binding domain-containing protein, AraC-type [Opitutaceae bacterium TAV1]
MAEHGIHVGRIEDSLECCPLRSECHRHNHFEFFWITGEGSHFNDFDRHTLRGRSLVIVSPGQVHAWPASAGLRGTMIGFTEAFFDGREPPPSALLGYPFVLGGGAAPVLAVADNDPAASSLDCVTGQLEREFAARSPDWLPVMRGYLRIAFAWAARLHAAAAASSATAAKATDADPVIPVSGTPATTAPGTNGTTTVMPARMTRAADLVRRFRVLLEEKFCTTTTPGDYARTLGVTAGHLNDTLREQTGRTAGEHVRARVLLEARRLLLHSGLSVSEIAYRLGFDDPSYFARFFRRETGVAPGEFRADIRENYRSNASESRPGRLITASLRAS